MCSCTSVKPRSRAATGPVTVMTDAISPSCFCRGAPALPRTRSPLSPPAREEHARDHGHPPHHRHQRDPLPEQERGRQHGEKRLHVGIDRGPRGAETPHGRVPQEAPERAAGRARVERCRRTPTTAASSPGRRARAARRARARVVPVNVIQNVPARVPRRRRIGAARIVHTPHVIAAPTVRRSPRTDAPPAAPLAGQPMISTAPTTPSASPSTSRRPSWTCPSTWLMPNTNSGVIVKISPEWDAVVRWSPHE